MRIVGFSGRLAEIQHQRHLGMVISKILLPSLSENDNPVIVLHEIMSQDKSVHSSVFEG